MVSRIGHYLTPQLMRQPISILGWKRVWTVSSIGRRYFSNCSGKDQTPREALQLTQYSKFSSSRGTGLFLVPAPEKGVLEWKVVAVKDLTYQETLKRSENCISVKWIPEILMSYSDIKSESDTCNLFACATLPCPSFPCICKDGGCKGPTEFY